jgi:hypothetical protein
MTYYDGKHYHYPCAQPECEHEVLLPMGHPLHHLWQAVDKHYREAHPKKLKKVANDESNSLRSK